MEALVYGHEDEVLLEEVDVLGPSRELLVHLGLGSLLAVPCAQFALTMFQTSQIRTESCVHEGVEEVAPVELVG